MASLPYVTAPGNVTKALNGIAAAATPDRVSQDFVKEILKIPGGSGDQMTAYLKKVGMANPDGTPTSFYKKFRNPDTRGHAAADILKEGYSELYKRNEYTHELSDSKLRVLSSKSRSTGAPPLAAGGLPRPRREAGGWCPPTCERVLA